MTSGCFFSIAVRKSLSAFVLGLAVLALQPILTLGARVSAGFVTSQSEVVQKESSDGKIDNIALQDTSAGRTAHKGSDAEPSMLVRENLAKPGDTLC